MGMRGLMLLSRIMASMTLNKWSRRVCKQVYLVIRMQYSREFLGGTLVLALELIFFEKWQLLLGKL